MNANKIRTFARKKIIICDNRQFFAFLFPLIFSLFLCFLYLIFSLLLSFFLTSRSLSFKTILFLYFLFKRIIFFHSYYSFSLSFSLSLPLYLFIFLSLSNTNSLIPLFFFKLRNGSETDNFFVYVQYAASNISLVYIAVLPSGKK